MKRIVLFLMPILMVGLLIVSCAQPAPTPTPTPKPTPTPTPTPSPARPYFEGKTIRWIVAFSPGGAGDLLSRLYARFMQRYIPGEPRFVIENMPGAGGLLAVKYVYGAAKPDGLTMVASAIVPWKQWLAETKGQDVGFDSREMPLVYGMASPQIIVAHADTIRSFEDLVRIGRERELLLGVVTAESHTVIMKKVALDDLGVRMKIVPYGSSGPTNLAFLRGEVDLTDTAFETFVATFQESVEKGELTAMLPSGSLKDGQVVRATQWPDLPTIWEAYESFTGNPPTGDMAALMKAGAGAVSLHRALRLSPGTPPELVDILRTAASKMLEDPELQEAYFNLFGQKLVLLSGEEAQQINSFLLDGPTDLALKALAVVRPE